MPRVSAELLSAFRPGRFEPEDGEAIGLPYRLMSPLEKTSNDKPGTPLLADDKYPLVLFLHGAGERGSDNKIQLVHAASEIAKRREQFPAYVVFPQCPKEKRWVESPWDLPSGRGIIPKEPSPAMKSVLQLVDQLIERHPIDPSRVYVTGLSMGGQGSWYAAVAQPKRFAAMLEVCGGGDPSWAKQYDGIPIWAFHGQADNVVPISRGREMIQSLVEAGHHPELRYVEYPDVKHDSWTQTFARNDVYEWLFAQKKDSL